MKTLVIAFCGLSAFVFAITALLLDDTPKSDYYDLKASIALGIAVILGFMPEEKKSD